MVEPATGIILGGSIAASPLILKILGPTADYIGGGLKDLTQRRVENVQRIFENAGRKLGDKIEKSEHSVPPRVLKGIFDEGSYCGDALGAEYFGGVLASSRGEVSRDDRGAVLLSLLGRLSTYQIRTHYIFYTTVKTLFDGESLEVGRTLDREQMRVFVPWDGYSNAMDFDQSEKDGIEPTT